MIAPPPGAITITDADVQATARVSALDPGVKTAAEIAKRPIVVRKDGKESVRLTGKKQLREWGEATLPFRRANAELQRKNQAKKGAVAVRTEAGQVVLTERQAEIALRNRIAKEIKAPSRHFIERGQFGDMLWKICKRTGECEPTGRRAGALVSFADREPQSRLQIDPLGRSWRKRRGEWVRVD